ncbi:MULTISPECIES: hypothetical protein [Pseudacidovorax]|jgi:hypothetical protein|uniref:YXWGXW repeat-containing protein n=1 Tax=Pseudacidovorax intermedius TaxID=433924 RepID=A0A370FMM6_9BURK|nr:MULTISPECIES: hypothetical protein [Pseudacidovorax]MBO9642642.1 hypothetical protein [Pseudacidovorax sp.]MBP6898398.1 hypothetical protein [Pseudacidovorax sp.]RDI28770.1 hypothetical protein DFR41_101526 [Pseudacidovorax intermedius]
MKTSSRPSSSPFRLCALAVLPAALLAGCVVAPEPVHVVPRPVVVTPPVYAPPPTVVYVAPTYAMPAPGYVWHYHPRHGWGWYHPVYGWHRGWH